MSSWTQIKSLILIDIAFLNDVNITKFLNLSDEDPTPITNKDIEKYLKNFVSKLPKITGSEGDACISVNPYEGPKICYFLNGKEVEYNLGYSITIVGNLRDRTVSETKNEYNLFLKELKKNFSNTKFSVKTMTKILEI